MKKWFQFISLLILAVFLLTPPLIAEEETPLDQQKPDKNGRG